MSSHRKSKTAPKARSAAKSRQIKKSQSQQKQSTKRLWIFAATAIAIILVAVIALTNKPEKSSSLPLNVSVAETAELRESGALILDVRTQEEWNTFHIPKSTLIPLDELESRIDEIPTDQPIIVVCRSGNRSQEGRDKLINQGIENVASMIGGVTEWRDQGYPTASGP